MALVTCALTAMLVCPGLASRVMLEEALNTIQSDEQLFAEGDDPLYDEDDEDEEEGPEEVTKTPEGLAFPAECGAMTWPKDADCSGKGSGKNCRVSTVRYSLPKNFEGAASFKEAVDVFNKELKGCVEFKDFNELDSRERQKVKFKLGVKHLDNGYCANAIGRSRKKMFGTSQTFQVSTRCFYRGSYFHELGHTLGFTHKQNRLDRDEWLTIVRKNIIPGKLRNFNKKWVTIGWAGSKDADFDGETYTVDAVWTLDQPFDIHSVMLYKDNHFTSNGANTMVATPALRKVWAEKSASEGRPDGIDPHTDEPWHAGHREYFSGYDLQALREMYKCANPPQQKYSWEPLPWDVVFHKPLKSAAKGWSKCPVPCDAGQVTLPPLLAPTQRRLLACRGSKDLKTYEDEKCAGQQLPPALQRCPGLDQCSQNEDDKRFVDVFGDGCKAYNPDRCAHLGFLGANRFCPASCASPAEGGAKSWSKQASLMACKEHPQLVISIWRRDVCRRQCEVPGSPKCGSCQENNDFVHYGTLGKCMKSCEDEESCHAITVAFARKADESSAALTSKLTHCNLFNRCTDFTPTGYRFHVYWHV